MSNRLPAVTRLMAALAAACFAVTPLRADIVPSAGDRPIPEPAFDDTGDYIWWDGTRNMTFYQLEKVVDLSNALQNAGEWTGLAGPREALNVDELDEVPDSTWFTNRHARQRLTRQALTRGPNRGSPPSAGGALTVISGKALGQTPGFVIEDETGRRFLVKFDPPEMPEMATGAEVVSSKILHALGWNVPEYHLFRLDPKRLRRAPDAWVKGKYNIERPMTREDLDGLLARAAKRPDGTIRAVASPFLPGIPKGPFRTQGVRPDDPNDTIPHEDRRELRGLRVVAAWINYTDARRGNFYDAFIPIPGDPEGRGYLVHYILDFSSTLGSGNIGCLEARLGHEYFIDPLIILKSLLSLGLWVKPWEDPAPPAHPALCPFEAETFDPDGWRTTYPQPLFDRMTERDARWGAKLVASFTDEDLRIAVRTGEWADPGAEEALFHVLRGRRDRIVARYLRGGPQGQQLARAEIGQREETPE